MKNLYFDTSKPFDFHWTGKFQAPDKNWIHMTRPLTDFEFVIVTEGDFYIGDGAKTSVVHKGQYRIMTPTENQHGTHPSACSFYWMHFMASQSKAECAESASFLEIPEQGAVPHPERLIVLLKQLSDCDKKYGNHQLSSYLCTAIILELQSQLKAESELSDLKKNQNEKLHGAKVALYSDVINYINWRIKDDVRVSEIAAYFGYNEKYMTTFFKKASGKSLKQFILERKMEEAKALLSDSTRTVSEIAYSLGFSDNHNFSRAFKKVTGQSPSEYRDSFADRMLYNV